MTKVHCLDSSCKHMYKQWCSLKEILVVNNVDTGNNKSKITPVKIYMNMIA